MLNQYLTTTNQDYYEKKSKSLKEEALNNKTKYIKNDIIANSFKTYLCVEPCEKQYFEDVDTYINRTVDNYPGFKYLLKGKPVNHKDIHKDHMYNGHTMYECDYCDIEKDIAEKERRIREALVLPNDIWVPLTTQTDSYRFPLSINSSAYDRVLPARTENNLDPNLKLRKILRVTTGGTEYRDIIGKLGEQIAVEELHGHVPMV